jgi:pimeloyl-ACP methyl ester carboxylesterase
MKTNTSTYFSVTGLLVLLCLKTGCHPAVTASLHADDPGSESSPYKYKTNSIILSDGTSLAYTDTGKGAETILFIHGLGSYLPAWNKNIDELSKHYRTIAIDLPGYGKSSTEGIKVGMSYYAHAILELLDSLKIEQAVLAGHSMGGQVAVTTALQAPERVKKLILAAPAGLETFTEQQKQLLKLTVTPESIQKTTPEQIEANFSNNFYRMPEDARFMVTDRVKLATSDQFRAYSKAVAGCVAAMVDEPVAGRLAELQFPTLIIFGEKDALIPNRFFNPTLTTADIASIGGHQIKNSKVVLLPDAGHFLQFEQATLFNNAIKEFLTL